TGGRYMWRTTDAAANWEPASNVIEAFPDSVSTIAVAPSNGNFVLAGTTNGTIHRTNIGLTSDGTTLWASAAPRTGYVAGLAFHPTDPLIAYATYSTFGGVHVWKTTNGGATWVDADGAGATGIPDLPCHGIVVDAADPSRVYVGTDLGVFVSLDAGATWSVGDTGFANVVTEALVKDGTNLFAFTHGRGAWKVFAGPTPSVSVDDVSIAEGDTGSTNAVFTLTLSSAAGTEVRVDFATADVTATSGVDYAAVSGTVTFPTGTLTQIVSVPIFGDTIDEPDESFTLDLSNPVGATIGDGQSPGTI